MKVTKVWSFLAAGAVLLVSATGLSGDRETSGARLAAYEMSTSQLWATPSGGVLTAYLNRGATQYLAADLSTFEPPDPCLQLATVWNRVVAYDAEKGVKSTKAFEILLVHMGARACAAEVTNLTDGSPLPLVKITPTSGTSSD